jgi:hypothetical protein
MAIHPDRLTLPSRNKIASVKIFADLLAVPRSASGVGSGGSKIDMQHGGSIVYWNAPDGHQWEMLTVSYAGQD